VYGDGSPGYQHRLRGLIESKGLRGCFVLRPKQMDVSSIYRSSRAILVASYIESFSVVAIEAMSHSKPVISTKCGGPEEIVEHGKTGFLFERGDSRALAEHILQLMDDNTLCESMGRAAREGTEARFDIRKIAEDYLCTILAALEQPRTRSWASRRRLLARLLEDGLPSGEPAHSDIVDSRDLRAPQTGFSARIHAEFGSQAVNVPVSTADLCSNLEFLRSRLHDINAELGDT
jgi:hypothetical protein